MKAKIKTLLIAVAMIAYWFGLCNASAFYDPGPQRWLNRDPIQEDGGKNLFTYVNNSPVLIFDRYGWNGDDKDESCPPRDPCDSKWPSGGTPQWDKWIGDSVRNGTFTPQELLDNGVPQDYLNKVAQYYQDVAQCNDNKGKDPRIKKLNDCRAAYLRGERKSPCGSTLNPTW